MDVKGETGVTVRNLNKCFSNKHPACLIVAIALLAALALACSAPAIRTTAPAPPVAYAEEPGAPTPEPTAPAEDPAPSGEAHEPQAMPVTPPETLEESEATPAAPSCPDREMEPLPTFGGPGRQDFWNSFRTPLPPAPVWNPAGPKRVGLQAGHWRTDDLPRELARLAGGGTSGGGRAEWQVNLDIAERAALILEGHGVDVDVLPETVPPGYRAHVFLAIHADGDLSGLLRGFKVARAGFSPVPEADDALVDALNAEYGPTTGLRRDDAHISRRMQYYYAFNSRRYCHAIAPGVPAAIIETGFLTNAADRQLLLGDPDTVAIGIARGVLSYLGLLN